MDDFSWIILAAILVLGLPVLAIAAFLMVLGLRRRVTLLEETLEAHRRRLDRLEGLAPVHLAREAPRAAAEPAEPVPPALVAEPAPIPPSEEEAAAPPSPTPGTPQAGPGGPAPVPPAVPPRRPAIGLEEKLGARWAVWVGGLALALGGVFLVRYSIEEGLLGPGVRVTLGVLFALALLAAGEMLRRRDPAGRIESWRVVSIPAIVTAAGTAALFAAVFAAHALYGFIDGTAAFVILGAVGLLAMAAAMLHGPWLAGLGLVASYATPPLVATQAPNLWALAVYLLVVTAAAFALARLRLWRWLAVASLVAALGWGVFILLAAALGEAVAPGAFYVLALAGLTLAALVIEPHRGRDFGRFDWVGLSALAGVAALALLLAMAAEFGTGGLAPALAVAAALLAAAVAFDAVAPAAGLAALLALGLAVAWPVGREIAAEPITIVPHRLVSPPLIPEALTSYLTVLALCGGALLLATVWRLVNRPALARPPAVALALAGTAGPLLILAAAYVRATGFAQDLPFGAAALALAALFAGLTRMFLRAETAAGSAGQGAAASLHAAGSTGALALALTMTLEGAPLTLAFALAALGASWVSAGRPLPALRWSAAALALLVLTRAGGSWTVLGEVLTAFPGWSDILMRFIAPALALAVAGWLLRRQRGDTPAAILDGASILLLTAGLALSVRLSVQGPQAALTAPVGLAEGGLYAAVAFGMAVGLARGALTTTSLIHRIAAPIALVGAVAVAVLGPLVALNPVLDGGSAGEGLVGNDLLLGYALPAALAALAGWLWSRIAARAGSPLAGPARPLSWAAAVAALLLAFAYVTFETRVVVSGPDLSYDTIPTAESYAYSAVWLLFGIALLAGGLFAGSKGARLASAAVIVLTVAKVFLFDMSDLEGVWRALSFIGLGLVLIGIGLVYQRFLIGGRRTA